MTPAGDPDARFTTAEASARLGIDERLLTRRVENAWRWAAWLGARPADGPVWSPRDLVVMAYLRDSQVSGPSWCRSQMVDLLRRVPWGAATVAVTHQPFSLSYAPAWSAGEPAPGPAGGPMSSLPCGGPDYCFDDLCRGQDYGVCGEPSDTEVCLAGGPCGDRCTLDHTDGDGYAVDDTGVPPRSHR